MTTTVTVEARAWGASVETNGERIEVPANQERKFHIEEGSQDFKVTQPAAPPQEDRAAELQNEEVPGRAQNDALLGKPADSNETAQTSDTRRSR